jgi:hypothetical protein
MADRTLSEQSFVEHTNHCGWSYHYKITLICQLVFYRNAIHAKRSSVHHNTRGDSVVPAGKSGLAKTGKTAKGERFTRCSLMPFTTTSTAVVALARRHSREQVE